MKIVDRIIDFLLSLRPVELVYQECDMLGGKRWDIWETFHNEEFKQND